MSQVKIGSGGRNKKKPKTKKKAVLGRPPKPKDELFDQQVVGYLDRGTYRSFRKSVKGLGYTNAEAVREAVMLWIQELDNQRAVA